VKTTQSVVSPTTLRELDFAALRDRAFFASPAAWEDQVLYFLMLDRFSDGRETGFRGNDGSLVTLADGTPRFTVADRNNAVGTAADATRWRDAGTNWCGGTLRGLAGKLGYLQRLGVTALWVSPLFKQVGFEVSYHGYGIQNFLEVDPHFGTREDLRDLVAMAHALGIRVILDIILNHTGNVFGYEHDATPLWNGYEFPVAGWRDAAGHASLPFVSPAAGAGAGDAVWPREFQSAAAFTRKGKIRSWDYDPEYLDGDFESLKDVHLGRGHIDDYEPSPALVALADVYKYWIAYADLDGFRIDTVKHMDPGAARYFASVIHEFAQSLGKENFYLIGEITGGRRFAFERLEATGLDAALGVDDIPDKLEFLVKGWRNPVEYFDLFRNSLLVGKESHTWFRNKVVTLFDDHDQVRKGNSKARFCAGDPVYARQVVAAVGLTATTLGIPLIYYGTEQALDGAGGGDSADRYLRECLFGGEFGAFRSRGRHCFDENHPAFRAIAAILALRKSRLTLRRGRQYLRQISGNGVDFGYPAMFGGQIRSVVPWSRLFDGDEVLCVLNTDPAQALGAWAVVDADLHSAGEKFCCTYSTEAAQRSTTITVETRGPMRCVRLELAAAGFAVWEKAR
jgi:glycosidase